MQRALELSRREGEGAGGSHGEELQEVNPDLASARAASLEDLLIQPSRSLVMSARRSSEHDLQEVLRRSLWEPDSEKEQTGKGEGRNRVSSPLGADLRARANLPAEPHAPAKPTKIIQFLTPSRQKKWSR